jgi:hypothetical protein
MRKFLILTATTAALAAAPAFAQDVTGTVNVTGEVAPRCQFTVDSVVLPLGELALSSNGELDTAKVDDETANLAGWCNGSSAQIKVEAFPLVGPSFTGDTAAFTNTVNYTATATANSVSPTDTTTTPGAGTPLSVGIFSGQIQVKLSGSSAASKKLVAGDYTGSVVVTLTPNVVPVQTEL